MSARISMVIPTLNAAERLPELVRSLQSQTIIPDEIMVVDSTSEDGTADVARGLLGVSVKVIDRKDFNHGMTRHEALLETTGDIVCFMTDDAIPANEAYIENLVAPMADPAVAMVSGRQLPKDDARKYERLVREYNYGPDSTVRSKDDLPKYGIKTYFATDVCSAYRRSAYLSLGGFKRVRTNEDMLMAAIFINSGLKVAYAADAAVFHSHNLSPLQQFERNKAVGAFLEEHSEELACPDEVGEGASLAKKVASQLLREGNWVEFVLFGIDCFARFFGNRAGRRAARKEKEIIQ